MKESSSFFGQKYYSNKPYKTVETIQVLLYQTVKSLVRKYNKAFRTYDANQADSLLMGFSTLFPSKVPVLEMLF